MADTPLTSFVDTDEFLRRVLLPDHVKNNVLGWRAFKDNDPKMSWTYRAQALQSRAEIDEYQAYYSARAGRNLRAILQFTFLGLTKILAPPLVPEADPDASDERYGHLHYSTSAPADKDHMKRLAKLVNDADNASILAQY
jgi:hypothetical protein